jgi:hypothetical protein
MLLLVLPLVLLAASCADFEASLDPAAGLPDVVVQNPSFTTDVAPIFERRCAIGGCHSVATAQGGLVLAPELAYDRLVNRPSRLGNGALLVSPGQAAQSWLVHVIGPDDALRQGFSRMPLASQPLTPNQIATIVNWIDRGAPRN